MIKTTRYCDICGKIIDGYNRDFYQMQLPEADSGGHYYLSKTEKDICSKCFKELYWKIGELKPSQGVSFL